jgi:RNA polymerase II-associated protein 1
MPLQHTEYANVYASLIWTSCTPCRNLNLKSIAQVALASINACSLTNMAVRGQRFELDLDADNFTATLLPESTPSTDIQPDIVKPIKERVPVLRDSVPAPPKVKTTRTGFPEHQRHKTISAFKQRQLSRNQASAVENSKRSDPAASETIPTQIPPSDRAIVHHVGKKYGYDIEAQQKAEISDENKRRIAEMSMEDIEEARAELMATLHPTMIERLLRRANIDDEPQLQPGERKRDKEMEQRPAEWENHDQEVDNPPMERSSQPQPATSPASPTASPSIHFPVPPRSASSYTPLNPDDPNFLKDLKTHYFPDTPHDPSLLSWLHDPSIEENEESLYNPDKESFPTSSLRFSFVGKLIPPKESLEIDVNKGLHHHGLAPSSAGYTIPELAILSRSTLPNQRCIAFQVLGRILFRLGRGDFGPRGSELQEGLWSVIENERVIEIIMKEANHDGRHMSAKAYAMEALWLWKRGGGGDRGLLRESEKIAK